MAAVPGGTARGSPGSRDPAAPTRTARRSHAAPCAGWRGRAAAAPHPRGGCRCRPPRPGGGLRGRRSASPRCGRSPRTRSRRRRPRPTAPPPPSPPASPAHSTASVAPIDSAASSCAASRSTATIGAAPTAARPITAESPTPPQPITAARWPGRTPAVRHTAQMPVVTAQPTRPAISSGTSSGMTRTSLRHDRVLGERRQERVVVTAPAIPREAGGAVQQRALRHQRPGRAAQVREVVQALGAAAAGRRPGQGDVAAGRDARDAWRRPPRRAAALVAQHRRAGRLGRAVDRVLVGVADAARVQAHQHLAGAGRGELELGHLSGAPTRSSTAARVITRRPAPRAGAPAAPRAGCGSASGGRARPRPAAARLVSQISPSLRGQRVWNTQPDGGFAALGISPCSRIRWPLVALDASARPRAAPRCRGGAAPAKTRLGRAHLHQPAEVEHRDPVGQVADDAEVVGDEQVGDVRSSRCRSASRLRIAACTDTSSAEVGSSQTTSRGSPAKARAMATRCLSPPESCDGPEPRGSGRPASPTRSARAAAPRAPRRDSPASLRQRAADDPPHRVPAVERRVGVLEDDLQRAHLLRRPLAGRSAAAAARRARARRPRRAA